MRLRRMAANRRVSGQAGVSGRPRWRLGSSRRAIVPKFEQVLHFAGLRVEAGCSMSVALVLQPFVAGNRAAQFGMFTQRVRGERRRRFLLGAMRRGVAF
jgi:hypothetical protein